jgi:hypothetical protein
MFGPGVLKFADSQFAGELVMRKTVALPATLIVALACCLFQPEARAQQSAGAVKFNPLRDAYYGDLHLHTSYSLDAYLHETTKVDPDQAYRFAKGEVVNYLGQPVQRREPLDFLAVTDHSEILGVFSELEDPSSVVSQSDMGKRLRALLASVTSSDGRIDFTLALKDPSWSNQFGAFSRDYLIGRKNKLPENLRSESRAAWTREIDFANRHYEPGRFTTFIAYEWSATPSGANLHRNVIFKGNSAPYPFTSLDSKEPQDLWDWLEAIRKNGYEALAIPHNGNASNGLMYDWVRNDYMDRAYAEERQANEPLSEIAQHKGASETHPLLSPNDEFANYEIFDFIESGRLQVGRLQGSYLRDALSAGLVLQRNLGTNPFKYGFVGGSDLHSGLSVSAQADYAGSLWTVNMGGGKPTKEQVAGGLASSDVTLTGVTLKTTSGNLTGAWAQSNTRESIYDALRRRETFATSGTRLKFRFFGGWSFPKELQQQKDWISTAYAKGVPMGGDLPARPLQASGPSFAIWAVKDANSGNLDRVQVIKVWEKDGQQNEKVFDVVWAGQRKPDSKTGKLLPVGDSVDLRTGKYTNTIGAAELETVWTDTEFDPRRFAAYYLRVLEIPTPRWSTLLAIEDAVPLSKDVPATEQQRGWSSPIWYTPTGPLNE